MLEKLTELENQFDAELRPATALERLFTSEIAYAAWELGRVRANRTQTAAALTLDAAFNRATRNWNRANKELQLLQTARSNRMTRVQEDWRDYYERFILLDPARFPVPKRANPAVINTFISPPFPKD